MTDATPPVDVNPVLAQTFDRQLAQLVKLSLTYVSLEQKISKAKERVSALVDRNTGTWLWAPSPNTIGKSQGYVVEVDNLAVASFPTGAGPSGVTGVSVANLRVVVRFFGFLLVLEAQKGGAGTPTMPPTE
jgi:hypothetical protein